MTFKPQVEVNGQWCDNALVFATYEEAFSSVRYLSYRWMLVTDSRVIGSTDPVNYRLTEAGLESDNYYNDNINSRYFRKKNKTQSIFKTI
jgi:hypothetical protein